MAKLIGEQDVDKARGDAMCADAMRTAKCIVKTMGGHKTRISLQINIEGIKIVEERSGNTLHSFPVSRISFVARDSSDARAFGLVYGEQDGRYKFYGIKTAHAADQAVMAIRDMFQLVFEMKKKQIEQVKQQQQVLIAGPGQNLRKQETSVAVADLLDLESELEKIEQGVQQLSSVPTTCDAFGAAPFGDHLIDSFNTTATSNGIVNGAMNLSQNMSNLSNLSGSQDPFGGVPLPPVQLPQSSQNWPIDLLGLQSQPPMHQVHSTPAFGSIGYAETNPFAAAPPPLLPTSTPALYRDPFAVSSPLPTSTVDWTGCASKENSTPQYMHHASTYSSFGADCWKEKKVTSLEDAFTKLVDLDSMVGGSKGIKKNPFDHVLNPPKVNSIASFSFRSILLSASFRSTEEHIQEDIPSLNSLSTTCSAAQMAATQQQQHSAPSHVDPFGDFFR
ncbi:CBN-DAB-1 protein [Caenorhabditis brenneri]|uniref:CBN-DAB-1 protein n=1 Tax=Caenorhabditis brenneri TaxID=135651 RepID=G0PKN6_CAEBE|nr:CBN-DAB-1 protein [Caenorhabditis brenneri]